MSGGDRPPGVGIAGLGFMGRTHLGAYHAAGDACRVVGVFDLLADRLTGEAAVGGNIDAGGESGERLFDPAEVFATDSLRELLARPEIDVVSVCTPTDSHVDVAVEAVRAGKHVLVEKPVSLSHGEIERLAGEAERAGVVCMPAMCMRFWPAWVWLKERVGARGAVGGDLRGVSFERIGSAPGWGGGFYQDPARCGGAIHDLHIHDTDFVCHLFGMPDAVTSVGDRGRVTTAYHFADGPPHVVASGGWLRGGAAFRMRYLAEFEEQTADFDLTRDPELMLSGADGQSGPVELEGSTGYDGEIRAFLRACGEGGAAPVTLHDAASTLAVIEAEIRSLESGERVRV